VPTSSPNATATATARPTAPPSPTHGPTPTPRRTASPGGSSGAASSPGDDGGTPLGLGPFGPADGDHGPLGDDPLPSFDPPAPVDDAARPFPDAGPWPAFDWMTILPILLWATTSALGVGLFATVLRRTAVLEGNGSLSIFAVDRRRRRQIAGATAVLAAGERAAIQDGDRETDPETSVLLDGPAIEWGALSGRPALRFDAAAARNVERRTVGYRQVRISAGPDDVRTAEVGRIDRGDEIEVIGEDASYFRIRTPDGIEGWVPRYVIL
jgi:hypothetical protein